MNNTSEVQVIGDLASACMREFISKGLGRYYKLNVNKSKMIERALKYFGYTSLSDIEDGNSFLESYMEFIEGKMKEVISKYTCHELLFWTRRIAPMNVYNRTDLTVLLYREALNNAITKYGDLKSNFCLDDLGKTVLPIYLKSYKVGNQLTNQICKVIADSYYLEDLASLYIYITQRYRIINKGGRLAEDSVWGFDVRGYDDDLRFLIDLYDERTQYNNLLAATGTFIPRKASMKSQYLLLGYRNNVNCTLELSIPLGNKKEASKLKSNYIPVPIEFNDYVEYVLLFEEEIIKYYEFSPKVFISFVSALSMINLSNMEGNVNYQYQLFQRAYTFCFSLDEFFEEIIHLAKELYKAKYGDIPESFSNQSHLVFKLLTSDNTPPRDIELWTGGPRKVIYPTEKNEGIIDYSGLSFVLSTFMFPISRLDGEAGNKRSHHFERKTIDFIKNDVDKSHFWIGQREIFNLSKTKSKEIDASFYIDNILFIVECKSVNVSFGFEMGGKKALDYRKNKNIDALNQVEQKVQFLIENKDNLNIPLPETVEYIIPVVVSPFAEYIWERDKELFISEELPRILTIEELAKISKLSDWQQLLKKEYCYKL